MNLHTTTVGDGERTVAFCHGLFGQGKNWTAVAKALGPAYRSVLLDMPNHGRSDWTESVDYGDWAELVAETLRPHAPLALVGHSMGGKLAMQLALRHPDLVTTLVVVDVAPVDYQGHSSFRGYVAAMRALDLTTTRSRQQADEGLREAVPDPVVRSFLLQNLRRDGDGWRWQPNLELLDEQLDRLGGWQDPGGEFDKPVLWVAGADSRYIGPEAREPMRRLFPQVRQVTVKNAGHWVHSEQPEVFVSTLRTWLDSH